MDKETLSNYGWIVICVLVLAVMLALATPFGSFIAGAIKSTTAGLFSVNQAALGSAGIDVNDMVFENCDHYTTEIQNARDDYSGDTVCKDCGQLLEKGQAIKPKVPEGGKYTAADGTVYNPGDEMPETVTTGDVYEYGHYRYSYNRCVNDLNFGVWSKNEEQNGWGVMCWNSVSDPGPILESINGKPITNLYHTFAQDNLTVAPSIPSGVTCMEETFYRCDKLVDASNVNIPTGVTNLERTFTGCKNLTILPNISNATHLTAMQGTFSGCSGLVDLSDFVIPNSVKEMIQTFSNCTNLVIPPSIPYGVTTLAHTFSSCSSLADLNSFAIPNSVTNMSFAFYKCSKLTNAPIVPNSVEDLSCAFYECTNLKSVEIVPSSVTGLYEAFGKCTSLTGTIEINSVTSSYTHCFEGVNFGAQNLTLTGTSTKLDKIGVTGINYCIECNGKCNGGH